MRLTRIKMIAGVLAITVVMALGSPNLALAQRGGGHGGGPGGGGPGGGGPGSGGPRGGGGGGGQFGGGPGGGGQARGGGQMSAGPRGGGFQTGRGSLYSNPQGFSGGNPGPGRGNVNVRPSGRGGQYDSGRGGQYYSGRGGQFYGGSVNGPGAQFYGGRGGQYYGGSQNWNGSRYPYGNRYSSGYRGNFYGNPGIRIGIGGIGIGAAFGPYGYGAFPWYNGGAFYGGGLGYGAAYRGYGNNYGNTGGTYYSQTVPVETQQAPQQLPPEQDYVPQLNNTTAELATAASGRAALGVTLDPQYPSAAVVREVIPGSPAERAGLRPGDMITMLDQRQVQSYDDVVNLIGSMQPGATIAIQFVRPILRSEVQAAAPEQQLSTGAPQQQPSTTMAIPPAAPSSPQLPAPQISQ